MRCSMCDEDDKQAKYRVCESCLDKVIDNNWACLEAYRRNVQKMLRSLDKVQSFGSPEELWRERDIDLVHKAECIYLARRKIVEEG